MSNTSLTTHVAPIEAGAHVVAALFLKDAVLLALGDGAIVLSRDGEATRIVAHRMPASWSPPGDANRLVTGGDDGRVVAITADGAVSEIADRRGRRLDRRPGAASRRVVRLCGRPHRDRARRQGPRAHPHRALDRARPRLRAQGLPARRFRTTTASSLWYPNHETPAEIAEWKGSHIDVTWSPDGRFVVSTMQENALHGWRLQPDRGHMRMSGYPAKVRSVSWSSDGHWLATSGAEAAIVWPFDSKEGPTGKAPRECGVRPARVSRVAFHPKALVLAIGYEDGCILLVRFTDASELLVRPAVKGSGDLGAGLGRARAAGWPSGARTGRPAC